MPIPFNPPEWLIQEYMRRATPAEQIGAGVGAGLDTYAKGRQLELDRKLKMAEFERKQQEFALAQQKNAREGYESAVDYGNVEALPADIQSGLRSPVQGPATAEGAGPAEEPTIAAWRKFIAENPQGLKGRERVQANRPQQVPNLINGKPAVFNPALSRYEIANVVDPTAAPSAGSPVGGTAPVVQNPTFQPRVEPPVPASEVAKTAELEKLLGDVSIVRTNFDKSFVGALDSRLQGVKQLTGAGATEKAAIFKSTISGMRNKLLNLLSGAAISPAEYGRLLDQLPNEQMSEVDFLAKLGNFERETLAIINGRRSGFQSAGYRDPNAQPLVTGARSTAPAAIPSPTAPSTTPTGLTPDRQARLAELRAKKAAGTLR